MLLPIPLESRKNATMMPPGAREYHKNAEMMPPGAREHRKNEEMMPPSGGILKKLGYFLATFR